MRRIVAILFLAVVAIVGLGIYQGWLHARFGDDERHVGVSVEVDRARFNETKQAYLKRAESRLREFESQLSDMRLRTADAPAETRAEREQELQRLEDRRTTARQQLRDIEKAPEDGWDDLRAHVDEAVDDLVRGIKRIDSSLH